MRLGVCKKLRDRRAALSPGSPGLGGMGREGPRRARSEAAVASAPHPQPHPAPRRRAHTVGLGEEGAGRGLVTRGSCAMLPHGPWADVGPRLLVRVRPAPRCAPSVCSGHPLPALPTPVPRGEGVWER